jgi:Na+/proline symporter
MSAVKDDDKIAIDNSRTRLQSVASEADSLRKNAKSLIIKNNPKADINDSNYVFLSFVIAYLPRGMIGILIAIILLAAMGATASGLNSLASTSIIDFYKRFYNKNDLDEKYVSATRWATIGWGLFCILAAFFASKLGNLIEAVNVLGSLFYGTILGIFLVAFYLKKVGGHAVFYAALITECFIIVAWALNLMAFLWLNMIGCIMVMSISLLIEKFLKRKETPSTIQ